jgi:hypothetical protein
MQVYADYLSDDPDFDRQQTESVAGDLPCPRLDGDTLLKLANYAISNQFGWPRTRPQPFELDVESLLPGNEAQRDSEGDYVLRLEVSGSGGGSWNVAVTRGNPQVIDGPPDEDYHVCAYLNVHTLRKILSRQSTVPLSLSSGGIILEGPQELLSRGTKVFEALCEQFIQAQWNRPGEQAAASLLLS